MALATVEEYVAEARNLLQDTVEPYRYETAGLLTALNLGLLDGKRLRPDLFIGITTQSFTVSDTTAVNVDEMYRTAFLYYMVAHAQLRDEEDVQDQRANTFGAKFAATLLTLG